MENLVRFGCKECLSPHLREKSDGKLHCISCGAVFERNVETDEERNERILYLSRLDSAEKLLRMSPPRFDDAEDEFRDFIKHYPNQSDGYWGLVRARYGIKYEDDVTGRTVPSCYKSSYEDFRRDSDFMKALELAENDIIYDALQDQAKLIAGVCKEWREEAGKYNYDIFISFKDEDRVLGISDADRNEMNSLYDFLKDEGYDVFFSPRSMRRYTGRHYDAYIFNALQSADAMIVYGSKPEYFTSTWVQNEWTRFLRMEARGAKKKGSCIVAYNGFSPKELHHDLRKLQAVDASQKRYYIDVLNCIKNILAEEKKVDTNEELMQKNEELQRQNEESKKQQEELRRQNEENKKQLEELKRLQEESKKQQEKLTRQNEENQKRQEELQKSLEEERKKNSQKQAEQKPSTPSTGEKNAPKAPSKVTPKEEPKKPKIDPDFEIVDGCLVEYKGNKAEVAIPYGITSIGDEAFSYCSSLTSVVIPDSVTSIGNLALSYCSNLTSIIVDSNNPSYMSIDGNLYSKDGKTLIQYAIGKKDTSFTIPGSVEFIGEGAFWGCESLTSVVIPDSVTSIGKRAFWGCSSLTSIAIPNSITSIGNEAFPYCSSLNSITVDSNNPNYMSIDGNLYSKDGKTFIQYAIGKKDTSFKIPSSVTSIGNNAFADCSSLTSVTIPDSVTSIGEYAFYDCSSLTSVVIPDGVTSIGDFAFSGCNSLTSVAIPDNVTSIGWWAFNGCKKLTIFVHSLDQVKKWKDWNPDNRPVQVIEQVKKEEAPNTKAKSVGITSSSQPKPIATSTASAKSTISSVNDPDFEIVDGCLVKHKRKTARAIIPDGVTSIGAGAFENNFRLKSIVIPDSVTTIGDSAFYDCTSLSNIIISKNVTSIGNNAFRNTEYYKNESNWIDNVLYISNHLIRAKRDISGDYTIKDGTLTIADGAFQYGLMDPRYANGGGSMFRNNPKLTGIVIPDSVTSIGKFAFNNCMALTKVKMGKNVASIGHNSFRECSRLPEIIIPDSVTYIGDDAFKGCKSMTIKVENTDRVKGWSSNWNPDNRPVQVIEKAKQPTVDPDFEIVDGCLKKYKGNKQNIVIPDGVTAIDDYTFYNSDSIVSVTIPQSITSIGYCAFGSCDKLTGILVDENNRHYKSIDGNLYSKDGTKLLQYASGKKNALFEILENVSKIEETAFYGCETLSSITVDKKNKYYMSVDGNLYSKDGKILVQYAIGKKDKSYKIIDGVNFINHWAFTDCYNLSSVQIPSTVTTIGQFAFRGCSNLVNMVIPNSVERIGNYAFALCLKMDSIVIGNSVNSINSGAFKGCENLTIKVHSLDQVKKWKDGWNPDNRPVQVIEKAKQPNVDPDFEIVDGCLKKYNGNKAKVIIPDNVTSIGDWAFSRCKSLTSVVIPDSVTSIGECAFSNCSNLTSVVIPDSVTTIGDYAFEDCSNLAKITVGKNNRHFKSIDGNLYSYDEKTLIKYATGKKDEAFKIPNSVVYIDKNAFSYSQYLTLIEIPESVVEIGRWAFSGCEKIYYISIPRSVTSIGAYAFHGCTNLKGIFLLDSKNWYPGYNSKISIPFLGNPSIAAKCLTSKLGENTWYKKK